MKPCMPGRNISILLNLIYFENLFLDIGFSSSYCFVPVYLRYCQSVKYSWTQYWGVLETDSFIHQNEIRIAQVPYMTANVSPSVL